MHVLKYLQEKFDAKASVFFQPCVNGDRPDIVILDKDRGLIVVEVKDWHLSNYAVDINNTWTLKRDTFPLRSPFAQAFHYKQTFFKLHINSLLEKAIKEKGFYGLIHIFVYFHGATREDLRQLYAPAQNALRASLKINDDALKAKKIGPEAHASTERFLRRKMQLVDRDMGLAVTSEYGWKRLNFPDKRPHHLFTDAIHAEFLRILSPPYHYANQGSEILYTPKQATLCESSTGKAKIRGLAGAGKTTVLAKRAVNAHQRHGGEVLILTFNLTLRMFIKDKINEVRQDFSWAGFQIQHYHGFITSVLGNAGIQVVRPPKGESADSWYESEYYSNIALFERLFLEGGHEHSKRKGAVRYHTILIDEIQDYKAAWLKILTDHFLEEGGELVLFGDERQNIYERPIDEQKKVRLPNGFGRWETLAKSFRYKSDSHILALASAFQQEFLAQRYEWEADSSFQSSLSMVGVNAIHHFMDGDYRSITELIIRMAKQEMIHPNDISVIAPHKKELQEIDYLIRQGVSHRENTLTTFATKELAERVEILRTAENYGIQPDGPVDAAMANAFPGGHAGVLSFRLSLQAAHKLFKTVEQAEETLKDVEKQKKYSFNLNSGVMKLSTTHSFKGFESPTVVLLVGEKDKAEMVYTGLTRAKENIVVFAHERSSYRGFFEARLEPLTNLVQGAEGDREDTHRI